MFSGLSFLINGDMAVATRGQGGLLARVDAVDGAAWTMEEGVLPTVCADARWTADSVSSVTSPTANCSSEWRLVFLRPLSAEEEVGLGQLHKVETISREASPDRDRLLLARRLRPRACSAARWPRA